MIEKNKKRNDGGDRLHQPVEAVGWRKRTTIIVEKYADTGMKLFRSIVACEPRSGYYVSSRSKALQHAFDYCNAHKIRVISVSGVRDDKFTLW